jgi:hypothetical protein
VSRGAGLTEPSGFKLCELATRLKCLRPRTESRDGDLWLQAVHGHMGKSTTRISTQGAQELSCGGV